MKQSALWWQSIRMYQGPMISHDVGRTLGFPAAHVPEGHGWQLEAEDVTGLVSQLPPQEA